MDLEIMSKVKPLKVPFLKVRTTLKNALLVSMLNNCQELLLLLPKLRIKDHGLTEYFLQ
jgi:hypothetical protein